MHSVMRTIEHSFVAWPTVEPGNVQSNEVTKICYIGGSGLSSHTYDLFIGRIAEFREVCSFHARRDERKNTRFLHPSFEGCSISVRQKQEMSICAVSRQEKEEMWMGNEARNE